MKVLKRKDWLFMQESTLTLSVDHTVLVEGKSSTTIPMSGCKTEIRVKIPNIYSNRSTAQSQKVWVRIP